MNILSRSGKPPRTRIRLRTHEVTAVAADRGTSVCCVQGQVWVTREGDARDYILPRGLCFVAATAGRLVVNNVAGDSVVVIGSTPAVGYAHQPLRIDWEQWGQIEHAARHARAQCLAAASRAVFAALGCSLRRTLRRAWRRVPGCPGAASTPSLHPSRGQP